MKTGMFHSRRMQIDLCGIAVLVVLSLIAWFAQISPLMARHAQAVAELNRLEEEREYSHRLEKALLSARENLDALRSSTATMAVTLKPVAELNQTLARLTEFASKSELVLDGIESGEVKHHPRYSTVAIRVNGRGAYRSCAQAIGDLRTAMPDIGVVGFQMTSPGPTSAATATFVLDLLWYTQPEPIAIKK